MENNNENNGFQYTYSAKEQAELKRIRDKYTAPTEVEDKMARLRRLDASVTNTAQAVALVFGVIGTLILGFGMSLVMTELAESLGLSGDAAMFTGITVGVVGGILASLAYPVYNAVVKAKREKLAPEIIRLADELMK
jgi:VIT1/CCC1 family predicted Fe2+/Mn2+ transporter